MDPENTGTTETPTSGPPAGLSQNIGDTSKLAFLANLRDSAGTTDDSGLENEDPAVAGHGAAEVTEEEPAPRQPADPEPVETDEENVQEVEDKNPAGAKNVTPKSKAGQKIDLSDVPEQDQWYFLRMDPRARDFMLPIYRQRKAIEDRERSISEATAKLKEFQYFHHPEAYKLTPEFSELNNKVYDAERAQQHYIAALQAIETGKPWRDIDEKGQETGPPIPPDPAHKPILQAAIMRYMQEAGQHKGKLEAIQEKYKTMHKTFSDEEAVLDAKVFGDARKHPEFVEMEKKALSRFRPELQHVPVYKMLASAWAMIDGLNQYIRSLTQKPGAAHAKAVRRQVPTPKPAGRGSADNGNETIADFRTRLKNHVNQ